MSNPGDDLDALATIAETRLEALMAAFLEARVAVYFSFANEVSGSVLSTCFQRSRFCVTILGSLTLIN